MRDFLKYRFHFLLLSIIGLAGAYYFPEISTRGNELQQSSQQLSQKINDVLASIDAEFTPDYFAQNFSQKRLLKEEVERLNKLPYELLIYRNDSLSFWSQNNVIPQQPVSSIDKDITFSKLKNGYYLEYKKAVAEKGRMLTLLVIIPVKYDYVTSNSYLPNSFGRLFRFPDYCKISLTQRAGYLPVKVKSQPELFFLGIDEDEKRSEPSLPALFFFIGALLFLLLFLNSAFCLLPVNEKGWLRPLLLFAIYLGVVFFFFNKSWLPDGVENWKIFDPVLFASGGVSSSLGALLVQLVFLLWICIHFSSHFRFRKRLTDDSFFNYIIHLVGYFIIFFFSIYAAIIIKSLVRDSKIEFAFLNPLEPDYFSIVGVLCIAILMFCLFLASEKIISLLHHNRLRLFDNLTVLLICTMISLVYYISADMGLSGLYIMVWINAFILLLPYFRIGNITRMNFTRMFMVLVFFACSGAALLFYYGAEKERDTRITFAKKLVTERDAVTEYLLLELRSRIEDDPLLKQYFKTQQIPGKEVGDRLQQRYFQEGFNRYSVDYYAFDARGIQLPRWGDDFRFVTEGGLSRSMEAIDTGSNQLFYSLSQTGNITYLAQYNLMSGDTLLGKLFVQLSANAYKSAGVYPELLLSDKDKPPVVLPAYSYAIYNGKQLIAQQGTFNYDYLLNWKVREGEETQFISVDGSNHLLYVPQKNIVIVVSQKDSMRIYFLSYFSFLFVVLFIMAIAIVLLNIVMYHPQVHSLRELFQVASLRTLIHAFFLIFILVMLMVTGYITGKFFLRQFDTLAQSTVKDKMNRIAESVQYLFEENITDSLDSHSVSYLLRKNINQLADVQDNEVNFYDKAGNLMASSQPSIFEKGIISRKINPVAFFELRKESQTAPVNEEKIGTLTFYSGYQVIRNDKGKIICFINLPYYNSRQQLNEQVGFFFVTLVNILVLAIIIAGLMAPFISRQITSKLSVISDKFKKLRVGETNELIEWHAQDEIGSLVNEYNKMIKELERSAEQLSRSQRELAWREMAKQVAHEIKNPLTPMKLSIQHLQRAYQNNSPNLKELIAKVSQTLIEQIDNLSGIATEFSNFAKMPRPEIDRVDVHSILKSSAELHKEFDHSSIHLHCNAEGSTIEADKNQLLSVFNNLILNAIQSIAEDKHGEINIITENSEDQLIVSVNDNGMGISEEEEAKVFMPNFTTKSSGTGLGLAISKSIIESFGGKISFTSSKEIGTTFYVQLPLAEKNNLS